MTDHYALDDAFDPGPEYHWEEIPADTPAAIMDALGGRDANRVPPGREAVHVVRAGTNAPWPTPGQLVLEDGSRRPVGDMLPADLPLGYHDFHPTAGDWHARVIVTPWRCVEPRGPCWGWAVQLHSTRSRQSWGIGDLANLRRLAEWSAGLGTGMMLVNPLGPPAPVVPQGASPYYPTTRRFRNPLYLCIDEVPGAERLGPELARLAAQARSLNDLPQLDRDRVFHLKQQALRAIWGQGVADGQFMAFRREQEVSLERFATFCVLAENLGPDWRKWPEEYRRPDHAAVARFAAGGIDSLVELLQGRLSKGVMERICRQNQGLFPAPGEIKLSCSCPDGAYMCKHVAAVLYGIGARFDLAPELLFRLRGVDEAELIVSAGQAAPLEKKGRRRQTAGGRGSLGDFRSRHGGKRGRRVS